MCAASTGSHFTSSGRGMANNSSDVPSYSTSSFASSSSFTTGSQNAVDTFAGFASYAPNGSASSPMSPVQPKGVTSETDEFLAVTLGAADRSQPTLGVADAPVGGPVNPLLAAQMATNASTSTAEGNLFPIHEVEPRTGGKDFDTSFGERKSKKGIVIVLLLILLIAAIFVGAFLMLGAKEAESARTQLADAVSYLAATDDVIDNLTLTVESDGTADGISAALEQSTTTQDNLTKAETAANEANRSRDKLTSEERDQVDAVLASVTARRTMLEAARMIQTAGSSSADVLSTLTQAYDCITTAYDQISYASELFSAMTSGDDVSSWLNTQDIVDYESLAIDNIKAAKELVSQAQASAPEVDYTCISNFLDAYGNVATALWTHNSYAVAGDWDSANAQMDWYNDASAQFQTASASMPASAEEYLATYGEGITGADAATYLSNYEYAKESDDAAQKLVGASNAA